MQFAIILELLFQQTTIKMESLSTDSHEIQAHPTVLKIKKTSPGFGNFVENLVLTYYSATTLMQYFGSISES